MKKAIFLCFMFLQAAPFLSAQSNPKAALAQKKTLAGNSKVPEEEQPKAPPERTTPTQRPAGTSTPSTEKQVKMLVDQAAMAKLTGKWEYNGQVEIDVQQGQAPRVAELLAVVDLNANGELSFEFYLDGVGENLDAQKMHWRVWKNKLTIWEIEEKVPSPTDSFQSEITWLDKDTFQVKTPPEIVQKFKSPVLVFRRWRK